MAAVKTISELYQEYGVSDKTFRKWLRKHPQLKIEKRQRVLTPRQVAQIYKIFGEP